MLHHCYSFRSKKWMINCRCADLLAKDASYLSTNCVLCADQFEPSQFMNPTRLFGGGLIVIVNNVQYFKWFYLSQCWLFCYVIMFFECKFMFLLFFLIFRQFNCLLILWCFCNCTLCDNDLFGGGLIVIVNHVFTLFYLPQCWLFCHVMFYDFTFLFNCGFYRNYAPCDAGFTVV